MSSENHLLQAALKLLLKKHTHAKSKAVLEQLQVELPQLAMQLEEVQQRLGKLLTNHLCTSVPVADLFLS